MVSRALNLHGRRFGLLVALYPSADEKGNRRGVKWVCVCDCGVEKKAFAKDLVVGDVKSCGCATEVMKNKGRKTHGKSKSKTHAAWVSMKARCYCPSYKNTTHQKKRLLVCREWVDSFESFHACVGDHPGPGYSLDRIDNQKGYESGNVRWASAVTQQNNTDRNRRFTLGDNTKTVAEWAAVLGWKYNTMRRRLLNWSIPQAFSTPMGKPRGVYYLDDITSSKLGVPRDYFNKVG